MESPGLIMETSLCVRRVNAIKLSRAEWQVRRDPMQAGQTSHQSTPLLEKLQLLCAVLPQIRQCLFRRSHRRISCPLDAPIFRGNHMLSEIKKIQYRRFIVWCLLVLPFLVPSLFLLFKNRVFNLKSPAIWSPSLLFIGIGAGAVAWCAAFFGAVAKRPWVIHGLYAVLVSLLTVIFVTVFLGSFYSNLTWGDNLTYQIVVGRLLRPETILTIVPQGWASPSTVLVLLFVSMVAVLSLIAGAAYWAAKFLRLDTRIGSERSSTLRTAIWVCCISISLWAFFIVARPDKLRGEPLLSFLMISRTADAMGWNNDRLLAAIESRQVAKEYKPTPIFDKRNVILIILESWRPDHLNINGYPRLTTPFLTELMKSGKLTVIDHAHSTCSETFCGVSSTLASQPFYQLSNDSFKLNDVLRLNGYKIEYNLSGDHRTWHYLWDFYGNNIDVMRDPVARKDASDTDDRDMIAGLQSDPDFDGKPVFQYFHVFSSHFSRKRLPEFDRYKPANVQWSTVWSLITAPPIGYDEHGVAIYPPLSADDMAAYVNHYDNGLLQADDVLRQIFETLKSKGYLRDSIVVIAGDHGDSLGERGHVHHARFLYEKDTRIPIMIYDDRGAPLQNTRYATQLDIAPTILAKLGIPKPGTWQGRSLTEPFHPELTIHQTRWRERPCVSVVDRTETYFKKYIACINQNKTISEEVFDLFHDPTEQKNLIATEPVSEIDRYRQIVSHKLTLEPCSPKGSRCNG